MRKIFAILSLSAGLMWATSASADGSTAAAETLFQEGQALFKSGRVHDACLKFAESQRLDPAVGTLINLGICYDAEGRTASAWSAYTRAVATAVQKHQPDRAASARARAEAIEKRLSRVTFRIADRASVGEIAIDGETLGEAAWTSALPLDPGRHVIDVRGPKGSAYKPRMIAVTVGAEAATTEIEIPALEQETAGATTTSPVAASAGGEREPSGGSGRRTVGFVVGGVGLAAVGIGAAFGLNAMSKKNAADRECEGAVCTNQGAIDQQESAKLSGTLSTISFAVGAIGLGVGTYLVLTGSPSQPTKPRVQLAPGLASMTIRGVF